eukprot:2081103-Rhodomonas_salina.1
MNGHRCRSVSYTVTGDRSVADDLLRADAFELTGVPGTPGTEHHVLPRPRPVRMNPVDHGH